MTDATCRRLCAVETCNMVIWEKVWENFVNLTNFVCTTMKTDIFSESLPTNNLLPKTALLGKEKKSQIDDKSKAALDNLINKINMGMNSEFVHKIKSVSDITKQLVAGMKYTFKFQIAQTTCKDKNTPVLDSCEFDSNSSPLDCTGIVVDRVWMRERYSNIDFNCKKTDDVKI